MTSTADLPPIADAEELQQLLEWYGQHADTGQYCRVCEKSGPCGRHKLAFYKLLDAGIINGDGKLVQSA